MSFNDLPAELLTLIFENLAPSLDRYYTPGELEPLLSVNRAFRAAAAPLRFRSVLINAENAETDPGIHVVSLPIVNFGSFTFAAEIRLLELAGFHPKASSAHLDKRYIQKIMEIIRRFCQGLTALRLFAPTPWNNNAVWAAVGRRVLAKHRFRRLRELMVESRAGVTMLECGLTALNRAGISDDILQGNMTGIIKLALTGGEPRARHVTVISALAGHFQRVEFLTLSYFQFADEQILDFWPQNRLLSSSGRVTRNRLLHPFGLNITELHLDRVDSLLNSLMALLRPLPRLQVLLLRRVYLIDDCGSRFLQLLAGDCHALIEVNIEDVRSFGVNWLYTIGMTAGPYRDDLSLAPGELDAFMHYSEGLLSMRRLAETVDARRRARGLPLLYTMFLELPWSYPDWPAKEAAS